LLVTLGSRYSQIYGAFLRTAHAARLPAVIRQYGVVLGNFRFLIVHSNRFPLTLLRVDLSAKYDYEDSVRVVFVYAHISCYFVRGISLLFSNLA